MKIRCQRTTKSGQCAERAKLFIAAYGGKSWDGYFCEKHGPIIIKVRMRLIRQGKQNVVIRLITEYDKKRIKERRK